MGMTFKPIRIFINEDQLDELITCCYREITEIREYTLIDGHDDEGYGHFVIHDRDDDLFLIVEPPCFMELLSKCLCRDYSIEDIWETICILFQEGYAEMKKDVPEELDKKVISFMVDPCKEEE